MTEKYTRFITLLKSMFELDKSDLDFGIYRIINIRREQILDFLENKLQTQVMSVLSGAAVDDAAVTARIVEIERISSDMGLPPENIPKYKDEYAELKAQLTAGANITELETDVYSKLYAFFNRYYDEGDFISKRRYKEGVYAIPYEGEEVKLYWANHDQYYIKTSENFKDYSFTIYDGKTVHFRLIDATAETANNKENGDNKRVFMLLEEDFIEETENELIIKFVYDIPEDKKIKYDELNIERLQEAITSKHKAWMYELMRNVSTDPKKVKTLIQKHLESYVAKNTFDYFIHKDLQGFLNRELDFFIKSEVMHLDDLDSDSEVRVSAYLAKVKAIKRVGRIIISFLAQIENFQKRLWLKKKFVVETNWCITLDRIDEKFYPEIAENDAQIQEWKEMYAIDEIEGDLLSPSFVLPLSVGFLKANKNLVVDTKHFTTEFKDRLIASIDNLDEQTSGLLIHSENFQALNLLQEKYQEQVKCVYIDPPYNTDASSILYKNNYKHSSFLSLLTNRLQMGKMLLAFDSLISVAIDDVEMSYLKILLSDLFEKEIGTAVIRSNPQSRKTKGKFSPQHEYGLFFGLSEQSIPSPIGHNAEKAKRYPLIDEHGRYSWMNFIRAGNNDLRSDRPKLYYPIVIAADNTIRIPKLKWNTLSNTYDILDKLQEGEVYVYPVKYINGQYIEKNWQRGHERVSDELNEYRVRRVDGSIVIDFKTRMDEEALPTTWWDKNEYASSNYAPTQLKDLFGTKEFDFAKALGILHDTLLACGLGSGDLVLDYFAGSGTTAQAVINLNREDNSSRKYILVEMGEYFNTVTKPRVKKVVYSADWKNGKPQNRNTGTSHIMKYMRLESYEDTLQNIRLDDSKHNIFSLLGDEYLLHYMLDTESEGSLLNLDLFKAPFSYKLNITEKNECRERNIDLCETFNYLIGLNVSRQSEIKHYSASSDSDGEYEGAVKLRLDDNGIYMFKMYEGVLRTGEKTLVIWRTLSNDLLADNAALDAFFARNFINPQDREFDLIFVNGDNNIENLRVDGETWKINLIEIEMKKRMFEGV